MIHTMTLPHNTILHCIDLITRTFPVTYYTVLYCIVVVNAALLNKAHSNYTNTSPDKEPNTNNKTIVIL